MSFELQNFRSLGTGSIGLDREVTLGQDGNGQTSLHQGESRLSSRLKGWFNGLGGGNPVDTSQRRELRLGTKQAFINALARSEGGTVAVRALKAAGLPDDWAVNDRPLTSRTISKVLEKAQSFRAVAVKANEASLHSLLSRFDKVEQRDLRAAISAAVRSHPEFGQTTMSRQTLSDVVNQASRQVRATQERQCESRFPGLTALARQHNEGVPDAPQQVRLTLNAQTLVTDVRFDLVSPDWSGGTHTEALGALDASSEVLGKSAWNQSAMKALDNELYAVFERLAGAKGNMLMEELDLRTELARVESELRDAQTMRDARKDLGMGRGLVEQAQHDVQRLENERMDLGKRLALLDALQTDLAHQQDLISSKMTYLQELRQNDPLSERAVAHSNLIWAQAGNHIIDVLAQAIEEGNINLAGQGGEGLAEPLLNADDRLTTLRETWSDIVADTYRAYEDTARENNSVAPPTGKKTDHPVVQGREALLTRLREALDDAGVSRKDIDRLTGKSALQNAYREALSTSELWQPVSRNMVVMRDGVVSQYTSKITPVQHWNEGFKARYTVNGQLRGVTAGEADNTVHARNLKVSELIGEHGEQLATVVGHGVLDMWKVDDPDLRERANTQGAREVLELAIASNPRLQQRLNEGRQAQLTHVSVNLISPDTLRSTWLSGKFKPDYMEKDYTEAQFRAFQANSGPNVALGVYNPDTNQFQTRNLDVNAITFSFGINKISTTNLSKVMLGVWKNVHAHNTENMIKLVGDLGQGKQGSQGARPGGFIGQVYDKLDNAALQARRGGNADDALRLQGLLDKLQVQTDIVRSMFTHETFASGNGDTAKMGREILALQALAERSLSTLHDLGLSGEDLIAATLSKGCKSDKDRGGVTDVELKSKLILQDMGGDMAPDERLVGDDQSLYYTVGVSSGQIENQRWNTGLGGSKETGHLKERIPDLQVREFLSGLGKFAKA